MMCIPEGYTEKELVDTLYRVAKRVAFKYRFGYHTNEDMVQQAVMDAWEKALPKYDSKRPLENFLYIHMRNRLFNFKRDNYLRPDCPCNECPEDGELDEFERCSIYDHCHNCEIYNVWFRRYVIRRNIMNTLEFDQVSDYNEKNMSYDSNLDRKMDDQNLIYLLDKYLPVSMRQDYTYIKYGLHVTKARAAKFKEEVLRILNDHGKEEYEAEEEI